MGSKWRGSPYDLCSWYHAESTEIGSAELEINGYQLFYRDRNVDGGGVSFF